MNESEKERQSRAFIKFVERISSPDPDAIVKFPQGNDLEKIRQATEAIKAAATKKPDKQTKDPEFVQPCRLDEEGSKKSTKEVVPIPGATGKKSAGNQKKKDSSVKVPIVPSVTPSNGVALVPKKKDDRDRSERPDHRVRVRPGKKDFRPRSKKNC